MTWLSPASVLHGFCFVEPPSRHDGVVLRVILVPMGNHSSSVFRRSTQIKVHVRCGLMPSPCTRNVGHAFRHIRSRSDGADPLHCFVNTNGNIAAFVVARMCVFHLSFRRVSDHHAHTRQLRNSARAIANVAVRATCAPYGSPFVHMAFVQASNKWKHALVDS